MDTHRFLGMLLPLAPAFCVHRLCSRQVVYDKDPLPPRRVYLLTYMAYQWLLFVVTWLFTVLAFLTGFLTLMLTLQNKNSRVFASTMEGVLYAFSSNNTLCHALAYATPVVLLLLLVLFNTPSTDRAAVTATLRSYMDLMFAVFVLSYVSLTTLLLLA